MRGLSDADFDTRDLEQAAADIANGVCPICEESLDNGEDVSTEVSGYHAVCLAEGRYVS